LHFCNDFTLAHSALLLLTWLCYRLQRDFLSMFKGQCLFVLIFGV